MQIIKLSAIDSTNDYLKKLASQQFLSNYTVVYTQNQLKGKGQRGAVWNAEPGKNLTFSVLINDQSLELPSIYTLNVAVTLAILEVLQAKDIPALTIKWPNDILSANKKIGGILIENSIKNASSMQSVVGIGLNVNQQNFDNLPQASSMYNCTKITYDCEELLAQIVHRLKENIQMIKNNQEQSLWKKYRQNIFKKDVPIAFEHPDGNQFMGIIKNVTPSGQLEVLLENDSKVFYNSKEIKMLY